jgi:transcriptional regulator GlxA family with amidase domain
MVENGDDTMSSIARRTGFGSPESMRRAFTRHLNTTPGALRTRFRTTGASAARARDVSAR